MADRAWNAAITEHDEAVRAFVRECERIDAADWQRPPLPGKWSPAAVALHLCHSYEIGVDEERRRAGMRMKLSPLQAMISRTFVLPYILMTGRFPRVRAPREVAPDAAEAGRMTRDVATERLRRAAQGCGSELRRVAREEPGFRFTHAYFGPLPPHRILRMLSAHTRHHTRSLARAMAAARSS